MNRTHRWLPAALLLLAALTTSQTASADAIAAVKWGKLPTLSVVGNGSEYTHVEPALGGAWEAEFEISSSGITRIKSWELYPYKPQGIGSPAIDLSLYSASKSYPFGNRPKNVHRTVGEIFPISEISAYAVARCNQHLYVLQNQGHSNSKIFSQEHKLIDNFHFQLSVDPTVGQAIIEGSLHEVNVICKAYDAPEPPTPASNDVFAPTFQVTDAYLQVLLDGQSAATKVERDCPVELDFVGHIQATGTALPATVQYRFEFATGEKSTVFSKVVEHTDGSTLVSHQIPIPLPGMSGAGSQADAGGSGASLGGFAQLQSPPPPLPEGVPEQPQGATIKGATLSGNEHRNDVRLVVLTHGGAVSAAARYHIVCKPKVNEGISGPAGVAPGRGPQPSTGGPDRPHVIGTDPDAPAPSKDITLKRGVIDSAATPRAVDSTLRQSPASPAPARKREAAPEKPAREAQRRRQRR